MKVTYNWLKDFVKIKIPPQALAEKLTMAGLEVTSLEEALGDCVFEIEVTPNRPDCLSVVGIAREVAAITNSKFSRKAGKILTAYKRDPARCGKNSKLQIRAHKEENNFKIRIENKKDCPLYTVKIIRNIKVRPSPVWLKKRLELIGCHSINNIVDVTNYILFTWGEPLHAFDLDRLASPDTIIVRRAKQGEKIITIDAEERMLNPNILVIADKERPVAIAGVMGGRDTEVSEETKNILLEAAVFNPIPIRRARQGLGLASESAYRFERGIDLGIVEDASLRAADLIQDLAKGKCTLAKALGLQKPKTKTINLEVANAQKGLGIDIAPYKIKKILNSLGFKLKPGGKDKFAVRVPAHRKDVSLEIDLIEEIARIFGYDRIPKSLPPVKPQLGADKKRDLVSLTKNILVDLGLNEVITYSLIDKDLLKRLQLLPESAVIEILNPLSKEQGILRPTLVPNLASCVAFNLNRKQKCVNIFEVAKAFYGSGAHPQEELVLGIVLSESTPPVLSRGLTKEEAGFLHLKGILEALFERLGIKDYGFQMQDTDKISVFVEREKIGIMRGLKKEALDYLDIKNKDLFALELSLDKVFSYADLNKKFRPLPKYPEIARDISFILKEDIPIKGVLAALKEKGAPFLREVSIVDYYRGQQIPAGFRGLTISCLYRSDAATLTEAEINPLHTALCSTLITQFGAKIR